MSREKGIVKNFSPAWFAAVMGTGGFANVLYLWGNIWAPSRSLGIGLAWLNALLFILIFIPWLLRWFSHFDNIKKDLMHPIMGNFFVTMPIGLIILASNAALMGQKFFSPSFLSSLALLSWLIGVLGALIFGTQASYNMMRSEQTPPQMINFAWLISPVASIAVPLIGNPLTTMLHSMNASWAKTALLINFSFWGLGFFLFLFIGAIVFTRFAQHSLPPNPMAPTFWIILGPIGVGTVSLMGLADSAKLLGVLPGVETLYLLANIIWGLGLWAILITLLISRHYQKHGGIPFTLSWWAFIFPLAAYTMASFKLGVYYQSSLVLGYTALLTALLTVQWILSFVRTLAGSFNGKLFQAPPQPMPNPTSTNK
ncbi:C4-dicarboxylate ABC transporter [Desulfitobacterium metallireducens]|uniref:C4-dicarboxylate ABC transporter n=1 Tax=Desulfitobacterium metallireducens DSM 15288 TaxID=871968 RepID=W0E5Y6_9FIRM|nr:C4-dicarboxylate ABC transporter [Desulfitobacterium metallireducens]AHF06260.1 C4-dicarboxylate ABC transporter [Desulfitobacterium metallireducens DSM 15288]